VFVNESVDVCVEVRERQQYELGTCLRKWGFLLDGVLCDVCTESYDSFQQDAH